MSTVAGNYYTHCHLCTGMIIKTLTRQLKTMNITIMLLLMMVMMNESEQHVAPFCAKQIMINVML